MEFKPTDVLLALMQFLEILVPGAFLAFVSKDFAIEHLLGPKNSMPSIENDAQGWVLFFVASYLMGHFVFLLASFIDDWFYGPVRRRWKPLHRDLAYRKASAIRISHLHDSDAEIMNTFKWTRANLNLRFPGAMAEVRRHESDSKFFRSLVIVFSFLAVLQLYRSAYAKLAGCAVLAALSFWRYIDQRWKSTELAYQYLIAMEDLTRGAPERAEAVIAGFSSPGES
jgi:hypothetical protein